MVKMCSADFAWLQTLRQLRGAKKGQFVHKPDFFFHGKHENANFDSGSRSQKDAYLSGCSL